MAHKPNMSSETGMKQMNKNGILIHQLPAENVEEVLEYIPCEWILNYFHNDAGLHIYFHKSDRAVECALGHVIEVRGQLFYIYLTVTNLTVHGVASCTRDIKTLMESNGYEDIVDFYQVEELKEHEGHKSFTILPDYRVILNVPEIFANYNLTPVHWPERPSYAFRVTFFCRLCRQNDHKAFQCPNSFWMNSAASSNVPRRLPHESYSRSLKDVKMRHFKQLSTTSYPNDRGIPTVSPSCSNFGSSQSCLFKSLSRIMKTELISGEDDDFQDIRKESGPPPESSNSLPKMQTQVSLSEGVKEAISKTTGVLSPDRLIQFINQTRGRWTKTLMEITPAFTTEVSALIKQLESVEKNYYTRVKKKGPNEDRDLQYLKRLRTRLKQK